MILGVVAAMAGDLFPSITTELESGVAIDWTRGELQITATSRRSGSEGMRGLEELARRSVDLQMTGAAEAIPIDPRRTFGDLRQSQLWPSLEPRIGRWRETENRYFSSGGVEVVGALSLVDLLKPVTMAVATAQQGTETERSGVTLDARGHTVAPCFAPQIQASWGVVYDGRMWLDAAVERAPAVWVGDAASPAAGRSGANPMLAAVKSVDGCILTLPDKAGRELESLVKAGRLGEGTLVIVVDP